MEKIKISEKFLVQFDSKSNSNKTQLTCGPDPQCYRKGQQLIRLIVHNVSVKTKTHMAQMSKEEAITRILGGTNARAHLLDIHTDIVLKIASYLYENDKNQVYQFEKLADEDWVLHIRTSNVQYTSSNTPRRCGCRFAFPIRPLYQTTALTALKVAVPRFAECLEHSRPAQRPPKPVEPERVTVYVEKYGPGTVKQWVKVDGQFWLKEVKGYGPEYEGWGFIWKEGGRREEWPESLPRSEASSPVEGSEDRSLGYFF